MDTLTVTAPADSEHDADPREPLDDLFRDLDSRPDGLSAREAARRLVVYGPNTLVRRGGRRWPRELARQFTHPLALLLALAAVLAGVTGTPNLTVAIFAVIVLNAFFAFAQEMQAERAVEALAAFLPDHARVMRDGSARTIPAADLVPGDLLLVEEGERACADARLADGEVDVDLSALTGESASASRRRSCRWAWPPACRSPRRRASRSACWSPTSPKDCCRRSRSRWRSEYETWHGAEPW